MWSFLTALLTAIAHALIFWRENKQREEGRQEAVKETETQAKKNEAAADAAVTNPTIIERVRSRFDRSRRSPTDQ